MRSEFDEVFKDAYDFCIDDADYHVREAAEALADTIWQHQQSKITLLENKNEYLTKTNGELAGLIIDLRNRVDAALARADQACIGNEMFYKQFDDVVRILRGIHKPKDGAV
ncbi:hypothetical protein ACINWC323_2681 [Acinetobacter sp. WC-323]|uniref:hypothetical protein n=1 Tax=Acinetobacter sp. WC-323 TaxID=903918 RepID=UPI00029DD380|nr:hypothetical protein [Acinetobacter sp. WC-323]EKU56751.1 hypothetical protein ACINWC323_2681 [Acinetobacter sp. WC-323]